MKRMSVSVLLLCIAVTVCMMFAAAETAEDRALPDYVYPGDDPVIGAVADYTAENAPGYWDDSKACVVIPVPVILKTVSVDAGHTDVYGNFWRLRYILEGSTLVCVSGGEAPGIMHLESAGQKWTVTSVETAGDGDCYGKDIIRFCSGDKELEKAYFGSSDIRQEQVMRIRTRFIREYVEENCLAIDSYQDLYWDAIPLSDQDSGHSAADVRRAE